MRQLMLAASLVLWFHGVADAQTRAGRSERNGGPRKVVVGTTILSFYRFPGQEQRLRDIESALDQMAAAAASQYPGAGLDLAVLPEEMMTLGSNRAPAERALELTGPEMRRLRDKARQHQTYIVVPLTLVDDRAGGSYSNAAVLLDRKGNDIGVYRKVHPVAPYDSDILEGGITPGGKFPVFECDFGKLGIQICWDMSFEDGWRELSRGGAEMVALPTASPQTVRPAAHALRGGYYVISSTPRNNASIFNPVGRISAQTRTEGVLVHQIDLSYAVLNWSPTLRNGRAFADKYGERAGYLYYEDEDCGLFWSNDSSLPIRQMVSELGQVEMRQHIERTKRLQDLARP